MRDARRTTRFAGPVWKIGCAVAALLLTLAGAEAVARVVLPAPQVVEVESPEARTAAPGATEDREQERGIDVLLDWSGHRGVRLNPNVRATIRNHSLSQQDVVIETNSLGLRHPELSPADAGADRILVLGDSITFCDYVAFEDTYTTLLGNALERAGRDVEVVNGGLPGASTVDELSHYLELRDAVAPDTVLLAMYLNDAQNSSRFYARSLPRSLTWSRLLAWAFTRVETLRVAAMRDVTPDEIDPAWAETFRAGRDLRSGDMWHDRDAFDFEIYNAREDFGIAWTPDSWAAVEPIVATLAAETTRRGERLGVMLFPVHIQVKGDVEDDTPQRAFAAMCDRLDLVCLDLRPALREDWRRRREELYFDHCHLRPEGNRVVADAVAAWMIEQRLVSPASD
jgi:lysophospholipase L1-like esterase